MDAALGPQHHKTYPDHLDVENSVDDSSETAHVAAFEIALLAADAADASFPPYNYCLKRRMAQ